MPGSALLRRANAGHPMTEPDVALTDYGLVLECAFLTGLLYRPATSRNQQRRLFALFLASSGIAALAGGTVHGFFLSEDSLIGAILWRCALVALGLTAFAGWSIGGRLLFLEGTARAIEMAAGVEWIAYAVVVLAIDQHFRVAVVNYLPSVMFLGISLLTVYRRQRQKPVLAGLIGLALTIVAAIVQQRRLAFHPTYFNHNALYHVIQMTSFFLIFLAGRHFIAGSAVAER